MLSKGNSIVQLSQNLLQLILMKNLRINGFSFIRHEDATVNNEVLVYSSRIKKKKKTLKGIK